MHGPLSGNRELLSSPEGLPPSGNGDPCALAVRADIDCTFPIGQAELDAIEAFLMPKLMALLNEEPPAPSLGTDSAQPQKPVICRRRPKRKVRHEKPGKAVLS